MEQQIKRALQDPEALTDFLRELEPFVYRVCYHLTGEQTTAETLAERTLLTICRELRTYSGDCALQSWVYRIILRLQQQPFLSAPEPKPTARAQHTLSGLLGGSPSFKTRMQELAQSLSGVDRQIFIMRFVLDLPLKEVAALLSLKESVVKSRFSTLRQLIAQNFRSGGEAV